MDGLCCAIFLGGYDLAAIETNGPGLGLALPCVHSGTSLTEGSGVPAL